MEPGGRLVVAEAELVPSVGHGGPPLRLGRTPETAEVGERLLAVDGVGSLLDDGPRRPGARTWAIQRSAVSLGPGARVGVGTLPGELDVGEDLDADRQQEGLGEGGVGVAAGELLVDQLDGVVGSPVGGVEHGDGADVPGAVRRPVGVGEHRPCLVDQGSGLVEAALANEDDSPAWPR